MGQIKRGVDSQTDDILSFQFLMVEYPDEELPPELVKEVQAFRTKYVEELDDMPNADVLRMLDQKEIRVMKDLYGFLMLTYLASCGEASEAWPNVNEDNHQLMEFLRRFNSECFLKWQEVIFTHANESTPLAETFTKFKINLPNQIGVIVELLTRTEEGEKLIHEEISAKFTKADRKLLLSLGFTESECDNFIDFSRRIASVESSNVPKLLLIVVCAALYSFGSIGGGDPEIDVNIRRGGALGGLILIAYLVFKMFSTQNDTPKADDQDFKLQYGLAMNMRAALHVLCKMKGDDLKRICGFNLREVLGLMEDINKKIESLEQKKHVDMNLIHAILQDTKKLTVIMMGDGKSKPVLEAISATPRKDIYGLPLPTIH